MATVTDPPSSDRTPPPAPQGADAPPAPDHTAYSRELYRAALEEIRRRRSLPDATYRMQLHAGFTFRQAEEIVPYLAELGISDAYASPYLKAAPGSTHGYDITDHEQLNPEIGTQAEHDAWLDSLGRHGIGLILDVVPNHMGILGNENPWWNDVLENGQASIHAQDFDIDWAAPTRPENRGRVLLPFLGDVYGVTLEKGELVVGRDGGAFHVQYMEHRYPLDPRSYAAILEPAVGPVSTALGEDAEPVVELKSILTALRNLPEHTETSPGKVAERRREKEVVKRRLATLLESQPVVVGAIDESLRVLNGTPGEPRSFDALDALLSVQPYRLAFWRVASDEINYRRFFDINTLVALRTDREEVMRATHRMVFDIVTRKGATGLRIDHPDGLLDPQRYLERLQQAFVLMTARRLHLDGPRSSEVTWDELRPYLYDIVRPAPVASINDPRLYVVVEKILGSDEPFPEDWVSHGTSGYDALNRINDLYVDLSNSGEFARRYQEWIEDTTPYRELVRQKKYLILEHSLASELHVLSYQLERIALRDRRSRDFTQTVLRHALREVIASFPVYRSYITARKVHDYDKDLVDRAVRSARRRNPVISRSVFDFLRDVLLGRVGAADEVPESEFAPADFAGKFQQVTAPVMAKGLEDTTFYVYNRLLSLNEVGGEPNRFGSSVDSLHRWNQERASRFPHSMTPLATHDTKRSGDVRARINVLSEVPSLWFEALARWSDLNRKHRTLIEDHEAPDHNEEYFFYQNLLGAWPMEGLTPENTASFVERVRGFMQKAIHEAKVHSSWQNPNPDYDQAVDQFVAKVIDPSQNAEFLDDFAELRDLVRRHGMINSLSQTLLKLAMPGVPDTYQGTELWDLSLVDPDNRRPVDYALRARLLRELIAAHDDPQVGPGRLVRDLTSNMVDGRIKLYLHWRALRARREQPDLFTTGEYRGLNPRGANQQSLFAFVRASGDRRAVVAVPRLTTRLCGGHLPLGAESWGDTEVQLEGMGSVTSLRNVFTGETFPIAPEGGTVLKAADLLASFPVALLVG
ncbi:Maltooligosyl trehalose synthase [Aquisphaera giovannonii]|uniref:Maltooligosyl trehalose synthase n=1 Tax=Aquisphaera giovannonii TaxID=406548 RepID=A0A5B9WA34_9BACT|nr:malto-oligosyltrehalose synthase [Aquisphaera giovannonii]QEH37124.1 Maltooligosyl trehalose synthase [Aquisphaera giovannonii]